MVPFDFQPRTRVVFGHGSIKRVGQLARELNFQRTLLVADPGVVKAGHVAEATRRLEGAGVAVTPYHDFGENPDSAMIEDGRRFVEPLDVDSIVGLGGGSSDAASVLLALNHLWGTALGRDELVGIAATLGADVPFFVFGETALARGIGERLVAMTAPPSHLVLAFPDAHVVTASIFAAPELTRATPSAKIDVFSESYGRNDLSGACCARHPAVAQALVELQRASPQARMTGSGACVFAPFAREREALAAAAALPAGLSPRVVRTLPRHPLAAFA